MPISRYRGQIVLLLDVCLIFACNFALFLPPLFRGDIRFLNLVLHIGFLTLCILLFQLLFRTYNSLWRYAESREYFVLLAGMGLGFCLYSICNVVMRTNPIWIIQALTGSSLALLAMLAVRFLYRIYRTKVSNRGRKGRYAAIIGAGTSGVTLLNELRSNPDSRYTPYCMIDDASDKMDKHIHGVPVRGPIDSLEEILQDTPVTDIILAISNLTPRRRSEVLHACAATKCHLRCRSSIRTSRTWAARDGVSGRPGAGGADRGSAGPSACPIGKPPDRRDDPGQDGHGDRRRRLHRLRAVPPDRQLQAQAAGDPGYRGKHHL